jgi:hypothetical protein
LDLSPKTETAEIVSVADVLRELATDPIGRLLHRWNWKSALLSSLFRAVIFFFANLTAGWRAAVGAMSVELLYRGLSAGFFGALTQSFRRAQPAWLAATAAMVLLPLASHSIELAVHWARGTPKLAASMISSVVFTVLSTLFHLYAMRRGVLIVGSGSRSLGSDFRAMPRVVAGFLAVVPLAIWRFSKSRLARGEFVLGGMQNAGFVPSTADTDD